MTDLTTGTDTRESRPVDPDLAAFDLRTELERLATEPAWAEHGRAARTLGKTDTFRLTLTLVRAGGTVGDDEIHGPLTLQVVAGEAAVSRGEEVLRAPAGTVVWLRPGVGWTCRAVADAAILISYAWPQGREPADIGSPGPIGPDAAGER